MTTHERQEYAAQLKREMNCCQAVVRAFADTLDMPVDKLMQLSAGFGSGMGTMEGTCGALAGAIVVAGLRTGGNGTMSLSRATWRALLVAAACRASRPIGKRQP